MLYNNDKLIAAAYVKARAEIGGTVGRDAKGNYGRYATLAAIMDAISAPLAKHGLAMIQEVQLDESGVVIETTLLHESGATMQFAPLTMPLSDRKAQAVGSAITYGRRYALAAICGLAADDDDDGQAAQGAQKPQDARLRPQQGNHANASKQMPTGAENDTLFREPGIKRATTEQVREIEQLGIAAYGNEWAERRGQIVEWASKGAVKDALELVETEAAQLVHALKRKVAESNGTPK